MTLSDALIMVVEDEADSMELIQGILSYHGVRSVAADSAEQALEQLADVQPDLIIIDLALPEMDGWSLLKKIDEDTTFVATKRVAVTAYHFPGLAAQALEAGFDAYFPKPIDATSFVRELEVILNG
jgi:CheY-like chemotaxis protein